MSFHRPALAARTIMALGLSAATLGFAQAATPSLALQ